MNTNNSFRQFIKDGLVGVAVVLIIFVVIALLVFMSEDFSAASFFNGFLVPMFFFVETGMGYVPGPMMLVILTAFISVGIGERFLGTITSRKDWIIPILKISVFSFLVGGGLSVIYWGYVQFGEPIDDFLFFMIGSILSTGSGAIIGFIIGNLAGVLFHPQRRFSRLVIGAMTSALVGYGVSIIAFWFSFQ